LPYFKIKKITYSGLKIVKQEEIERIINQNFLTRKKLLPANNYFLVSTNKIAEHLKDVFSLNTVQVKKIFPGVLSVEVEEKISTIIYDNGHQYFLLDQNGTAIKYLRDVGEKEFTLNRAHQAQVAGLKTTTSSVALAASSTLPTATSTAWIHLPSYASLKREFGDYPVVYDLAGPTTTAERQTNILKPEMIQGIIDIYNALPKGKLALANYFTVDNPGAGVVVHTNQAWKVFIQPLEDIVPQMANLKIVVSNNRPNEYIDVRFGERVYWK